MPIDKRLVKWVDAPQIDGSAVKWDDPEQERGIGGSILQGLGNLGAGALRGAGSIGATLMIPIDAGARALNGGNPVSILGQEVLGRKDRRTAMTGALEDAGAETDSLMFGTGKLAGELAGTMGAGGAIGNGVVRAAPLLARAGIAAPTITNAASAITTGGFRAGTSTGLANVGTRAIGGAINGGVSAGMINPNDAGLGAAIGGALPPVLMGLGKAGRTVGRSLSIGDGNRTLAKKAINDHGIPLGVGDIADGGTIKAVRSFLNDAPFSGGVGAAQRENVQEGFNRAVGKTFGAPEKKLTATVVDAAKQRMGAEFDRIWNNNSLQVDSTLIDKMMELQRQAVKLPKAEGGSLAAEINDLFGKMASDASGTTVIPGDVANKFQSYLRRRAEGSAGLKHELGDLRQGIISAFNRGIRAEDAAALTMNRTQYKAFKTVEPLLNGAEAGVAGRLPGDIPPSLLPGAVARQYSQAAGSPLVELSQIGSRFMVDRTAKTGGSMRAALQNTALGTAMVGGGLTNPLLAASVIPAGAGANALLGSPALAKMLLDRGPGSRFAQLFGPQAEQLGYRTAPLLGGE